MKTASSLGSVLRFVGQLMGELFQVHAADQFHGR